MARLSKVILVAALVAMLTMAPVLEARPLTDDSAVTLTHQRQLRLFGVFYYVAKVKLCIVTLGIVCKKPDVVVVDKPEYHSYDKYTPPPPQYDRKHA